MRAGLPLSAMALALAGQPGFAEGGPKPAEIAAFVAAVKTAGCVVSPDNSQPVIAASGLSPEVASAVAQRLQEEGKLLVGTDMNLTLVPELCK